MGDVVYQIYPRSFDRDLAGITARLDYVAALGVDAVWLTPFYPSPQADNGYDVSDYRDVDPRYGTLADFDELLARAHRLGLEVIIDVVPNHCSVQHPLFRAALAAGPGSPERARFHFSRTPNNWPSVFGGPAWTAVDEESYLHLYAPEQPDWNWRDPRTAPYFDDVLRFWFDRGVDGLRIDVAHGLFKAPGLPDHPDPAAIPPMRLRANPLACDQPEVHDVYRRWRRIADSYHPPRRLIGEVNLSPERAAGYVGPDRLHQAFAFAFLVAPWNAEAWRAAGQELLEHPPVTWVVENHDVVRTPTRYGSPARARAALLTILGLPGSAYLYQGQELGLPEAVVPPAEIEDPAYARTGVSRDGCRQPMPWPATPLPLVTEAIRLRRDLPHGGAVRWSVDGDQRLIARSGRFVLVVAMGAGPVPLPPGRVVLASDPLTADGRLPADAAAWLVTTAPPEDTRHRAAPVA